VYLRWQFSSPRRLLRRSRPGRAWRRLTTQVVRVTPGDLTAAGRFAIPERRWWQRRTVVHLAKGVYRFSGFDGIQSHTSIQGER
jgi:hypothetical protein